SIWAARRTASTGRRTGVAWLLVLGTWSRCGASAPDSIARTQPVIRVRRDGSEAQPVYSPGERRRLAQSPCSPSKMSSYSSWLVGAGPNDLPTISGTWLTPRLDQSQTPLEKILRSRCCSDGVNVTA